MGSSGTMDRTHVSWIGRQVLYHWATREALNACVWKFSYLVSLWEANTAYPYESWWFQLWIFFSLVLIVWAWECKEYWFTHQKHQPYILNQRPYRERGTLGNPFWGQEIAAVTTAVCFHCHWRQGYRYSILYLFLVVTVVGKSAVLNDRSFLDGRSEKQKV